MLVLFKRLKNYNEFQLTKNKMDLNNRKRKITHPPSSEESHPMTAFTENGLEILISLISFWWARLLSQQLQFRLENKKQVPYSMAIGNELVHECFPKHSRIGTARMN